MIDGPPDMDTLLANSAAASARAKATWAEALADADAARAIQAAVVARDETAASLMLAMIPTMHAIPSVRPPPEEDMSAIRGAWNKARVTREAAYEARDAAERAAASVRRWS